MNDLAKELHSLFSFTLTAKNKLKMGNKTINAKDVLLKIPVESIASNEVIRTLFTRSEAERERLVDNALQEIEEVVKPKRMVSQTSDALDMFKRFNRMAVDVEDEKRDPNIKLIDAEFNIMQVSFSAWKLIVGNEVMNETQRVMCRYVYEPHINKNLLKVQEGIHTVNTYKRPHWKEVDSPAQPILKEFLIFFNHLFRTPESRAYVCAWVLNATVVRNETYLVLCGAKGAGKNLFAQMLSSLFGLSNVNNLPVGAYNTKFNSFLADCQLVIGDEVNIKDSYEKNIVKRYANSYQSIERKGRDAYEAEIKCSFVFMSNTPRDLFIEPDDRRFSVVDLGESNLMNIMKPEEIENLVAYIESESFGPSFLKFCKDNAVKDFKSSKPFKGETFNNLVLASLKDWQYAIYDFIKMEKPKKFFICDIYFDWDVYRRKPKFETINTFLKNFTYDGKSIGYAIKSNTFSEYEIVVNGNFNGDFENREDDLC